MTLQFGSAGREKLKYGEKSLFEVPSHQGNYSCVFEDDGKAGYFYAVDPSAQEQKILDAMLIYAVDQIEMDDETQGDPELVMGWSVDGTACLLLINGYPQAVFDFGMKQGYCRSGFPPPTSKSWSLAGHKWNDDILRMFMPRH